MTGLIEEFCRSSRRNVAKTSREAFPYLLKLLNACRAILEKNAQEWDASPREDPVYEYVSFTLFGRTPSQRQVDQESR